MPVSFDRLFSWTRSTPAATPPAGPPQQQQGPLAPLFDRARLNQADIRQIQSEAQYLADGLKAMRGFFVGANFRGREQFFGYGSNKPLEMTIRTQLAGDRADMVVAMFVSGHDFRHSVEAGTMTHAQGLAKVDERAKTNSYNVRVTRPDGTSETMTGIKAHGARVTLQDITISKMQRGVTTIEIWPDGSAGVYGYVEGRQLRVNYDPPRSNGS